MFGVKAHGGKALTAWEIEYAPCFARLTVEEVNACAKRLRLGACLARCPHIAVVIIRGDGGYPADGKEQIPTSTRGATS